MLRSKVKYSGRVNENYMEQLYIASFNYHLCFPEIVFVRIVLYCLRADDQLSHHYCY